MINEDQHKPQPITGFYAVDNRARLEARDSRTPNVKNPTIQFDYMKSNTRAGMLTSGERKGRFADLEKAEEIDSYVYQSIAKHVEKIVKEGYRLVGASPEAVDYVMTRLDMMTASTGEYWYSPIIRWMRDYVHYGNGFLVKGRLPANSNNFTIKKKGMRRTGTPTDKKPPVGGYFPAHPKTVHPKYDDDGVQVGWFQRISHNKEKPFDFDDIVQVSYNKASGAVYGLSYLVPVLEDVRALRQCEQMVIELIYKNINPLIHHEVPDRVGNGFGAQRDVDKVADEHEIMAPNGYITTPPGHKIHVIGMESKALRAEGYLRMIKYRVYAGLGLSDIIMGESSMSSTGATDSFAAIMEDRVQYFQLELGFSLTYNIIWELLQEGGFDPIFNPKDRVFWVFNDPNRARRERTESHALLQYHGNVTTEDETRVALGRDPLTEEERAGLYVNRIQIPLAQSKSQSEAIDADKTKSAGTSSASAEVAQINTALYLAYGEGVRGKDALISRVQEATEDEATKQSIADAIEAAYSSGSHPDLSDLYSWVVAYTRI